MPFGASCPPRGIERIPATFSPVPDLPGLLVVQPRVFRDDRGWFLEAWKDSEFRAHGIGPFAQDNHSGNLAAGIVRGLHYQLPPKSQGKLVRCVRGRIWDVAVDLRPGPSRLRHASFELSAADARMLWIPPGFAHGYAALEPGAEVVYKTTAEYAPELDRSLRWDDPALAIPWPVAKGQAKLAPKDAAAPGLAEADLPEAW
jgi:dTDP-4-dehydrorhamnose 3,5-epimerase